jgi:hypothetical protein
MVYSEHVEGDGSAASQLRQEPREEFRQIADDEVLDDVQPSVKEVMGQRVNSPSAGVGGNFEFAGLQLVGHGERTSDKCGTFRRVVGCTRVELHNKRAFDKHGDLVNYSGKGYFKPVFHSCDKPSCPVCYERGWAVRAANNVDFRLGEISRQIDHVAFGEIEHAVVTIAQKYWDLDYKSLCKLCDRVLVSRGVVGGCIIPHGFRYANLIEARAKGRTAGWRFSPHFHVLGFIRGGMRRCRGCKGDCKRGCGGFIDRNYRLNEQDGCFVKVLAKRKSVWGTGWYQCHHATIQIGVKRPHVVRWFGIASYNKMKIPKALRVEYNEKHKAKCVICGSELVEHQYHGRDSYIIALFHKRRGARESIKGFFDKASEWSEVPELEDCRSWRYGGDSHE